MTWIILFLNLATLANYSQTNVTVQATGLYSPGDPTSTAKFEANAVCIR